MALPAIQRRAIRMLATAMPMAEICRKLDVTMVTLRSWRANPEFQQALSDLIDRHDEMMSGSLLEGELEALGVVREALKAFDSDGEPDWEVRLKASFRLLDAAGRRGKPSEKTETTVNTTTTHQGVEELAAALRDPTVQAWIEGRAVQRLEAPSHSHVPPSDYEILVDYPEPDTGTSAASEATLPISEGRSEEIQGLRERPGGVRDEGAGGSAVVEAVGGTEGHTEFPQGGGEVRARDG